MAKDDLDYATVDMFADGALPEQQGQGESQAPAEISTPTDLLDYAELVQPNEHKYTSHGLFHNIHNPQTDLYFDFTQPVINGIQYDAPLFLPMHNAQGELKQVAVMEVGKRTSVVCESKPQAFTWLGDLTHDKPVFIAYDLDTAFRLASCGYAVALVVLCEVLNANIKTELKEIECNLIKSVCSQLSKAGYKQLYIVSYPASYPKLHNSLQMALTGLSVQLVAMELHISFMDEAEVKQVINDAISTQPEPQPSHADPMDVEITRLATLSDIQYEQTRTSEAETLGIRASILDKLVRARRKELSEQQSENDFFEHVEAWHSPIDGGELLDSIYTVINNHIACEKQTAIAASLWIVFTWAIDVMQIAPIACITAPEKRCGKTQLLTLIGELCKKPLPTSNVTAAALYRAIEEWQPTLLIDEADTFLKDNEDIRGVINAGHSRKNAFVVRCDGDDNRPKRFNVWGAKAISGIGHLPETIKDRSIILELRRKLPSEHKQRLRHTGPKYWYTIKSKCLRWVNDNLEAIKNARPELPESLNDRAYDNWESLFIIAQVASDEWLAKANFAAMAINGVEANTPSINEQLLADIKVIFDKLKTDTMFTSGLIEALIEDELGLWGTWNHGGKPITPRQLANRLQSFGVLVKSVRIGNNTKKGYQLKQFTEAFSRYLPKCDVLSVTTSQSIQEKAYSEFLNETQSNYVSDKKATKPLQSKACSVVSDRNDTAAERKQKPTEQDNPQWGLDL